MKVILPGKKYFTRWAMDPLKALKFLRILGRIGTIWPINKKVDRFTKFRHEMCLWFIILNLSVTFITLLKSVHTSYKDPVRMARSMSQLAIVIDSLSHLIFYRIHRSELQVLLEQVFDFLEASNGYAMLIAKIHYKRFLGLYITLFSLFTISSLVFFCGALVLGKEFPIDSKYPFPTDSTIVYAIIYIHQITSIIQNFSLIIIDLLVVAIFWYAGAKLRILNHNLRRTMNHYQFKLCILKHQENIRYIKDTVCTVRFIIYKTVSVIAITLISAGIQVLYYDAKTIMSQFSLIIIVAILRVITFSCTFGDVEKLNENLRWTLYKIDWITASNKINRNLLIFIHRCQMPLVTVNGRVLKIMSCTFCTKFIYMILSNLATLKAIIERSTSYNNSP